MIVMLLSLMINFSDGVLKHTEISNRYMGDIYANADNEYLYLKMQQGDSNLNITCKYNGYCVDERNTNKFYNVTSGDENRVESPISTYNLVGDFIRYNYKKYDNELHEIVGGIYKVLLVAEDDEGTGIYTRAFYLNKNYAAEIDFVKDSSFAPDGIRISEHGILRDYFTDNSGYPTGFLFDEFSSSIRWVYPLKEIAINCNDLAIYAYTLNDNKDLVVFYNCDSAS